MEEEKSFGKSIVVGVEEPQAANQQLTAQVRVCSCACVCACMCVLESACVSAYVNAWAEDGGGRVTH